MNNTNSITQILFFTLLVSGCAFKAKRNETAQPEKNQAEQTAEQILSKPTTTGPDSLGSKSSPSTPVAPSDMHLPVTPTTTASHSAASVDPTTALRWLKNGNIRFLKNHLRNDGQSHKDIERLSTGQHPHTIVLSCSDSRVPPEIVFDQKLGEVFVVRTAGEALDPGSIASIEYAVEHLGVQNLLVMGHTQCGAVKAAFSTLDGKDAGSENLNKLVADIHPRISRYKGRAASTDYTEESWANVQGVISDLQKRSKILNEKSHENKIKISGALYHLDSGYVDFK